MKILLATDGSEHSLKTVDAVVKLAVPLKAEVTVLTVAEVPNVTYFDFLELTREKIEKRSKEILEEVVKIFREKGLEVKTILSKGHPAEVICRMVEEGAYDLVVLGSRGLGKIEEMFLGSVSNRVAHCSRASVLIIK
jgi:nucleotide-binding universal stress UspA family protein